MDSEISRLNSEFMMMIGTAIFVLSITGILISSFLQGQRRDRMSRILVAKTEAAHVRAASVILDAETRAMRAPPRGESYPFDIVHWKAIERDMTRAGLKRRLVFPPLVFLAAAGLSWVIAAFVIAAPIFPVWGQALAIYPFSFLLVRRSLLGLLCKARKMTLLEQLIGFIESVQRAVAVGTSPDEAVAEAIREAESPLGEQLAEIKNLLDLGYDFVDAINLASEHINMPEFDIFAASLSAQSTTGGSIGEVLKEVIDISRGRLHLQRKISTLTAEGQFNALILGALPILLSMYLRAVQPDYAEVLWADYAMPQGPILYFATLGMAVAGAWLALRISNLEV